MAGSLSNIGLGSSGALSYDIIDKLRKVDEDAQIAPIDKKLQTNSTKSKDLSVLTTLTASLKGATSSLADESAYLQRSATSSGSAVSVEASAGSSIQDFTLDVIKLAKQDIYESNSFLDTTSTFTTTNDTININIDGQDYAIDVTSSTTLEELKNSINDATDGKVVASLLNVGGTNPYKLVLKSTDTGADQAITVTSTGGGTAVADLGLTNIQAASDAEFTYNGVTITRPKNNFSDLIVGIDITLNEVGLSNVSIKQDTSDIVSSLEDFVTKYNDLMSNLNESTNYDVETKASGTFQGDSQIVRMKSDINRQLLSVDSQGRTLEEFGITLNENGMLEFKKDVFDAKMSENPDNVKDFFVGSVNYDTNEETKGIFTSFNDLLDNLVIGQDSMLGIYENNLNNENKALTKEREKAVASLDAKYNTMAERFMAYDAIIGKLNAQFQSLSMMIESSLNSK